MTMLGNAHGIDTEVRVSAFYFDSQACHLGRIHKPGFNLVSWSRGRLRPPGAVLLVFL